MSRKEVLRDTIISLIGFAIGVDGIILLVTDLPFSTRIYYTEIEGFVFGLLVVASFLLYLFFPKTASEKAQEEKERLAEERAKRADEISVMWKQYFDRNVETLEQDARKEGIPTADDIAKQKLVEEQQLRPEELIDLAPLPHFKGYILPPKVEKLPDLPDGKHQATLTNVGASSPDRGRLARSQVIDIYWNVNPDDPSAIKELIVKFGVIRVTARDKQLNNISAEMKLNTVKDAIHPNPMSFNMMNVGYLNWFSVDLKNRIMRDQSTLAEIDKDRGLGLNKYLFNPKETIHRDESKDLLVFYMIRGIPSVFICAGSTAAATPGIPLEGKPCEFRFEISITADDLPKTTWSFKASAEWDDFRIEALGLTRTPSFRRA